MCQYLAENVTLTFNAVEEIKHKLYLFGNLNKYRLFYYQAMSTETFKKPESAQLTSKAMHAFCPRGFADAVL